MTGTAIVAALFAGACGGDDEIVWDLRSPTTAGDLGGRGSAITDEGAARYTVRLPDRDIAGSFRSIDGLADPARRAANGGAIDTVALRYPFATTADPVADHIADIGSLFAIDAERQAALDVFVSQVRASAESNGGRIDVTDFEPGNVRARTSAFTIATEPTIEVELLVGTMDADTMALTLMIEFDPAPPQSES